MGGSSKQTKRGSSASAATNVAAAATPPAPNLAPVPEAIPAPVEPVVTSSTDTAATTEPPSGVAASDALAGPEPVAAFVAIVQPADSAHSGGNNAASSTSKDGSYTEEANEHPLSIEELIQAAETELTADNTNFHELSDNSCYIVRFFYKKAETNSGYDLATANAQLERLSALLHDALLNKKRTVIARAEEKYKKDIVEGKIVTPELRFLSGYIEILTCLKNIFNHKETYSRNNIVPYLTRPIYSPKPDFQQIPPNEAPYFLTNKISRRLNSLRYKSN